MATAIDRLIVKIEANTKALERGLMNVQNLLLGVGLSLLFTGMAIKRFFQTILTSLFQTFLTVEGEGGIVNNLFGEMAAKLAFIKFSFIDAFKDSVFFDIWVERINRIISLVDNLTTEQKAKLVDFAIKGMLVGAAMMVIGQAALFLLGPLAVIIFSLKTMITIFGTLKKVALLLFANPLLLVLVGLLTGFGLLIKRAGGLGNAIKAFGLATLQIFAYIGDAIISFMLKPINIIIHSLNLAISAANKLGANISKIPTLGLGGDLSLSGIVSDKISAFQSGIREERAAEINNNITIEGNADEGVIDKMIAKLEEMAFNVTGSPQQG